MIRINLLGLVRPKLKAKAVPLEAKLQILFLVLAVVFAAVAVTVHWNVLRGDVKRLDDGIRDKKADKDRMAQLQKEIDQFDRRKKLLQSRVDVIESLRKGQAGPYQLLDQLGSVVNRTDSVWLVSIDQKGNKVAIDGMAGSVNAVANFISNLKRAGIFKDVEIKESFQDDKTPGVTNFVFSLSAEIAQPQPAT